MVLNSSPLFFWRTGLAFYNNKPRFLTGLFCLQFNYCLKVCSDERENLIFHLVIKEFNRI